MSVLPTHLLPPNSTALEQELAQGSVTLDRIDPAPITSIWNAWSCPAALLPWLAWALSVDHWDATWPEVRQRQTIADSPAYHRRKGTVAAVTQAVDLLDREVQITEWFDSVPAGRRGTATIQIEAQPDEVAAVLRAVRPLVMAAKPKSRAVYIGAGEIARGVITIGGVVIDETLTVINPYAYAGENAAGAVVIAGGLLDETLTIVSPA